MFCRSSACIILSLLFVETALAAGADYPRPEAGKVRIVRDEFGVPHIMASDNYSLFFGAGYVQAEDQLENVVKNYRRAAGRAAELDGPNELVMDHLIRSLGVPARGDQYYAALPNESKSHVDGFAAGINAYIREHRDTVPKWIDSVRPQDVLRFSVYAEVQFSVSDCRNDLGKAGLKLAGLNRLPAERDQAYGSNQFAISARRSGTGMPQLSMDPHLPHQGFYRWYEMHLVGPKINTMGACFFGSPYVTMGRSPTTAWSMTVNGPDLGDVFAFDLNPDDPTQYRDIEGWKKFEDRVETYQVLMGDKLVEKQIPVRKTVLGPAVVQRDGKAYVFALPWTEPSTRESQFYDMSLAKSVSEFKDALRPLGLIMFNIVYADTAGDIFYISNGRIPKRDHRIDTHAIRPGHEAWARWQGFHSIDELPQVLNPPCGYMLNCNSGPQNVCPDVPPQPKDFTSDVMGQQANSRWRRLSSLLSADEVITPDEMKMYATDTQLEAAERWLAPLIERMEKYAVDSAIDGDRQQAREITAVLKAWDRRADLESRGSALFAFILLDSKFLPALDKSDSSEAAQIALAQAAAFRTAYGSLDAPWKEFSRIRRGSVEMGIAGFGVRSDRLSPFVALRPSYGELKGTKHYCLGGSSYGMIVDFSQGVRAVSCLPFGVSDDPKSKHFADQLPLYVETKFKPAWYGADEILTHAESNKVLDAVRDK